jgi:hypothetical protein
VVVRETAKRWLRCAVIVASAVVGASLISTASAAAAEAPRWQLQAVPTPTHVQPNTPRNELQKLTVTATGGTFVLEFNNTAGATDVAAFTIALPHDATAVEVQEALQALNGIGSGGVVVTGGPGTATPGEYEIAFQGADGDTAIEPLRVQTAGLTGGGASVEELVRGKNAPWLLLEATNVGGAATNGTSVTVTDQVPAGVTVTAVQGFNTYNTRLLYSGGEEDGTGVTCEPAPQVKCTFVGSFDPGDQLMLFVKTTAGSIAPSEIANTLAIEGGGAASTTLESMFTVSTTPAGFGPVPGSVFAVASSTQAGAHPNLVTSFWLNTAETNKSAANPKDIRFDLPPGLVGSTVGMPQCSMSGVISGSFEGDPCPADSMVGIAEVTFGKPEAQPETLTVDAPVYNIAPSPGEPAAFAFDALTLPVRLDTGVLSDGNYGVRVTAGGLNTSDSALASTITIWGVPAEHSGAGSNGAITFQEESFGGHDAGQTPTPVLTNPQQCGGPLVATMSADSWASAGDFLSESAPMAAMTGCLTVPFNGSFEFLPDTLEAGAPAGYDFNLHIHQQNTAGTLATSSVTEVHLTLPEGVVVNPSAAWGLKACSGAEFYGSQHPSQEPASPAECPREAKIGEVEVETPDLSQPLKGTVFLGAPECDPCTPAEAEAGKMVKLFVQLEGEGESGVIVKLEGEGKINQRTGQITTVFHETPQLPFSKMRFVLEGGPRAVLANPRTCGAVKTTGDLKPWSSVEAPGEAQLVSDVTPSYEFEISQNCFGPQFHPTLKAGMPNVEAGANGEFTLAFGRGDDDQFFKQITLKTPPGLLGTLTGVELCKEAQAIAGTCGANSLLGTAEVLTGPGADPFLVEGGKVYLTEGYGGSPYGLSIVVPAVAGPYTLGGLNGLGEAVDSGAVVVRSQIFVDPHTAQLTVASGVLPSMLDGIPLQLKAVNVRIDRPGFMFNPTNCEKMAITGTIASQEGMSANVSSPFQVTNCQGLKFAPKFAVSTSGKTSKADGASLSVKLTYPNAPQGSQANIKSVKVDLPKQLPSRLTTLQKACTAAQFDANPGGCPAASVVGHAKAVTPIVPVPLEGPAYFVSHGGEAFPSLIIVLQGYGVTVDLVGATFISHAGITSSTFKLVPDVPIGSFELTLPEGKFSALAANGNLCTSKLAMPTAFTGQNGAQINESTPIEVEGCSNTLSLISHEIKKRTLTLSVYAPFAGKLTATGKGLKSVSKTAKQRGTITFKLKQKRAARLKTTVKATFTPSAGKDRKKQSKALKVTFRK